MWKDFVNNLHTKYEVWWISIFFPTPITNWSAEKNDAWKEWEKKWEISQENKKIRWKNVKIKGNYTVDRYSKYICLSYIYHKLQKNLTGLISFIVFVPALWCITKNNDVYIWFVSKILTLVLKIHFSLYQDQTPILICTNISQNHLRFRHLYIFCISL